MNNHSYVYIPTDKLVAIIEESCPPIPYTREKWVFRGLMKIALNAGSRG